MCLIKQSIIVILLLFSGVSFANEINTSFGDRSWQFDTPSDKIVKQNKLMMYCNHDPDNCIPDNDKGEDGTRGVDGTNGSSGGSSPGGASGVGLGGGQNIGNNITVIITGDGDNVVTIDADQENNGNQAIDNMITDNILDITSSDQILNGDILGNVLYTDEPSILDEVSEEETP